MPSYTNLDNLVVQVGRMGTTAGNVLFTETNDYPVRSLIIDWRFNALPTYDQDQGGGTTPDSFSEAVPFIPRNSIILSANTIVTQAFTGGTSYTMGLYQKNGTAISATAIWTGMALASLNTIGKIARPDGVLVKDTSGTYALTSGSSTLDSYIRVVATGSFTAGRARTVIEYIPPGPGL